MKKLYTNGTIYTMDSAHKVEAVLTEDGRILATGEKSQIMPEEEVQVIDLKGKTMLPAFLDPHSHFAQLAGALMQVNFESGDDKKILKDKVDCFIEQKGLKKDEWVLVRGYKEEENRRFLLEELDEICKEYPMVIQYASGHMGLFNSKALQYFDLFEHIPLIEGGMIEQVNGRPTGYLEENAYFTYMKKMPMPSIDQYLKSFKQAEQIYASYGIATIQEGMFVKEMFPLYEALLHAELLESDIVIYPDLEAYRLMKQMEQWQFLMDGRYHSHVRLGGIKIFLDGSPQGRTAWLLEPYEGSDSCGYGTMSDEEVKEAVLFAAKEGRQLLAHCNGDAACEQYIRIVEEATKEYPQIRDLKFVIIHAQLLKKDQMERAKKVGMIPSFFAAHIYHYGDIHRQNLGEERAQRISDIKSAIELQIPFTMHQDTPVIMPDMMETIWCAVARQTKSGVILGEEKRISVEEAFKGITSYAAYQYSEVDKGCICAGNKAEFVMLEKDPYKVPEAELKGIQVMSLTHSR